jgi:hypothetical protein
VDGRGEVVSFTFWQLYPVEKVPRTRRIGNWVDYRGDQDRRNLNLLTVETAQANRFIH